MGEEKTRRRYWARSLIGWRLIRQAEPNDAHRALAELEASGKSELLLTQNVDRLHQAAGNARVIDLHGRIDRVRCMDCGRRSPRLELQDELSRLNADWLDLDAAEAPDGDADLDGADFSSFVVAPCERCGGVLKPDVVFFGENVPRDRVDAAFRHLDEADAMLVVGSSLMVYSGFRFVERAASLGKPVAAVNLGRTRADALLALKAEEACESALFPIGTAGCVRLDPACSVKTELSNTAGELGEPYRCASSVQRSPSSALSGPQPLRRLSLTSTFPIRLVGIWPRSGPI